VRELENAVKRALVLCSSRVLSPSDFDFLTARDPQQQAGARSPDLAASVREEVEVALDSPDTGDLYRRVLEQVEVPLIEAVLRRTQGNQIQAAALLGINRNTLRKKIAELAIERPGRGRA
jgi:two-component system, NtrC family, nitrogen regulation response regulator GlnG